MRSVYKEEVYSVYTSDEIIWNFVWPMQLYVKICKVKMSPGVFCHFPDRYSLAPIGHSYDTFITKMLFKYYSAD